MLEDEDDVSALVGDNSVVAVVVSCCDDELGSAGLRFGEFGCSTVDSVSALAFVAAAADVAVELLFLSVLLRLRGFVTKPCCCSAIVVVVVA